MYITVESGELRDKWLQAIRREVVALNEHSSEMYGSGEMVEKRDSTFAAAARPILLVALIQQCKHLSGSRTPRSCVYE